MKRTDPARGEGAPARDFDRFPDTSPKEGVDFASTLEHGSVSSAGLVREVNEDALGLYRSGDRVLAVVADGMGGHSSGEIASRICVEALREVFLGSGTGDPAVLLREGLLLADAEVSRQSVAEPRLRGMGATVVAAIVAAGDCWFSHLGDSRAYLVGPEKAERLTRDHTVLQELLEQGLLIEKQVKGHRMAHVVSKAVGHLPARDPGPEVKRVRLLEGNALLLCSDGLTDLVSDQEIHGKVTGASAQQACNELLDLVLARGAHDNVTIQVIRCKVAKG